MTLPGLNGVAGLWSAEWVMGNLGRARYGVSLEATVRLPIYQSGILCEPNLPPIVAIHL